MAANELIKMMQSLNYHIRIQNQSIAMWYCFAQHILHSVVYNLFDNVCTKKNHTVAENEKRIIF